VVPALTLPAKATANLSSPASSPILAAGYMIKIPPSSTQHAERNTLLLLHRLENRRFLLKTRARARYRNQQGAELSTRLGRFEQPKTEM
jgi:hypothetical protein